MVTLVGKQSALPNLLESLLALEYDAIAAYSVALSRVRTTAIHTMFERFRADHERHTRELSDVSFRMGIEPPQAPDIKAILTQGKVVIGTLGGDRGILLAMRSNEDDTHTAYERAVTRDDLDPELHAILQRGLADERRHHGWIDDQLAALSEASATPVAEELAVSKAEPS